MRLLLFLLLTSFAPAQTWFKVVPENGTATLPATTAMPITFRYGGLATATVPAKWCDSVTVTTSTPPLVASNGSIPCTINKVAVPGGDPDPGIVKELDVLEQAASFVVPVVISGVKSNVTVPALPAPPPPPPPASTTQTLNCTATFTATVVTPSSGTPVTITGPLSFTCTPVAQ